MMYDLIVVGGGAAGFFTAINAAKMNPRLNIVILERSKSVLSKVRISGGGRCNVTHAEFDPNILCTYYPRGTKELKGPFHSFMTGDTMAWFEERGVALKIEDDGRIFPVSNSSQTIIDCFLNEAQKYNIEIFKSEIVTQVLYEKEGWTITTKSSVFKTSKVMIATGSNAKMWDVLQSLGHHIVSSVPSLFTFNSNHIIIKDLAGIAKNASVTIKNSSLYSEGPVLITHWGVSGPAILKLSAWGAIELNKLNYQFEIAINWVPELHIQDLKESLKKIKSQFAKQYVVNSNLFDIPKRLWYNLVMDSKIGKQTRWADLTRNQLLQLTDNLTNCTLQIHGKSTFKQEFVTAGGVDLREVNFKTFESKVAKNLYLAGEVLNIDAVTGGFNFQNAWTGGFLAAKAIVST